MSEKNPMFWIILGVLGLGALYLLSQNNAIAASVTATKANAAVDITGIQSGAAVLNNVINSLND